MNLSLSEMLRRHRKLSGLSQSGLASLAGVGKTVIFDLEHGKESVRLDTLKRVLAALNIHITFQSPVMGRMERMEVQTRGFDAPAEEQRMSGTKSRPHPGPLPQERGNRRRSRRGGVTL
jgi:HTH-type transcriptional regulator/antitoxin HipB